MAQGTVNFAHKRTPPRFVRGGGAYQTGAGMAVGCYSKLSYLWILRLSHYNNYECQIFILRMITSVAIISTMAIGSTIIAFSTNPART